MAKVYAKLMTRMGVIENYLTTLPSGTTSTSTTTPGHTAQSSRPKIAEPPKYSGKKGSLTLEEWVDKVSIWFRYHRITNDEDKIMTAVTFLEGGAASFMDDVLHAAATGQNVGTWADFVSRLSSAYRELSPELVAQQTLEELCSKRHQLTFFAEKFKLCAKKTGYSDTDLIRRINDKLPQGLLALKAAQQTISPWTIPTEWEKYLDWALSLDMALRSNKTITTTATPSASTTRTGKPVNAIDEKKELLEMAPEQIEWFNKRLCHRCGKHPVVRGERCRYPKYNGYFKFPESNTTTTTKVRAVDETKDSDTDKMEFLRRALETYDKGKQPANTNKADNIESAARIEEIQDEQDFLRGRL